MKHLLALLFLAFAPQLANATASVVQTKNTDTASSVSSLSLTYSSAVTAGDSLVAFACWGAASGSATVSDTVNGSYTQEGSTIVSSADGESCAQFKKDSATAGTPTVTVTFSTAQPYVTLVIAEVGDTTGFDVAPAGNLQTSVGTGTNAVTSNSQTPSAQPGLLVGLAFNVHNATTTLAAGTSLSYTDNGATGSDAIPGRLESYRYVSLSSVASTFTASANTNTISFEMLFKETSTGACTHSGITSAGAIAVPNGSSGSYRGKSGAFVTPDCSTVPYFQTQGAFGVN